MGGWFRSELMAYVSVIMQQHVAHDALGRLGDMGVVQFEDVHSPATTPPAVLYR